MSENNKIQKIEEALKTYKQWRFENADIDVDTDLIKSELQLDTLCYILAYHEINIVHRISDISISQWQLPKTNMYRIEYEIRHEKLRVLIYRFHNLINIRIVLWVDVEQGSIFIEQITLFEP